MKHRLLISTLTTLLLIVWQSTSAQEEEESADDEIFELSPFVVSEGETTGYYASTTLAGTRIKTNLRDVASSVQVVTKEFMEDVGATDLNTLLQYTTSTETAGIQGNFVGVQTPEQEQTSSGSARVNFESTHRVRGLGAPERTRAFFRTDIPFDIYNSERIDINRGANSFLFGLGSSAGIVNADLKKAMFVDKGEVRFRIGSGGENPSVRGTLDYNKVLVEDKLALRFAGLVDRKEYRQKPTYKDDERFYATATYRPLKDTTIRAHFESGDIDGNPPDVLLPAQNLSTFLDVPDVFPELQELERLSVNVVDNVKNHNHPEGEYRPLNWEQDTKFAIRNLQSNVFSYGLVYDGTGTDGGPGYARLNGFIGRDLGYPNEFYGLTKENFAWISYLKHGNYDEFMGPGHIQQGFTNLDNLDFTKYNLGGANDYIRRHFNNANITLEQILLNGNAGIEVAFDKQEYNTDSYVAFSSYAENVFFDINEVLLHPDENGNQIPNPNYGRPAIMTQAWRTVSESEQEVARLSAFIKHDFRDQADGWLGRVLGRHRVSFLADREQVDEKDVGLKVASYGDPELGEITYHPDADRSDKYARSAFRFIYVGPPQLEAFSDPDFTMSDFEINPVQENLHLPDGFSMPVTYYDKDAAQWNVGTLEPRWAPTDSHSLLDQTVTSYALNTQSHLLDDLLVVNLGWRNDEVETYKRSNDAPLSPEGDRLVDPANFNLNGVEGETIDFNTFGYGFVLNVPRNQLSLPDWFDMSFHYSNSDNFQPRSGLTDYMGNSLPLPSGVSEDYGFTFYLFDSKLVARANWFNGSMLNTGPNSYWRTTSRVSTSMLGALGGLYHGISEVDADGDGILDAEYQDDAAYSQERLALAYEALDFLDPRIPEEMKEVFEFRQNDDGSYSTTWAGSDVTDVHDNETEGFEFEMVWNPTRQLRISFNASRYETSLSNVAPRLSELVDDIVIPYIENYGELGMWDPVSVDVASAGWELNNRVVELLTLRSQEGMPTLEQSKWNWGLVTNYKLRREILGGYFSFGAAARWQDSYAIGYELLETETGIRYSDVTRPYYGEDEFNLDIWFNFYRRLSKDTELMFRLQVKNVNNWDNDALSVVRAQPDGSPARVRFNPPREIYLTTTFRF